MDFYWGLGVLVFRLPVTAIPIIHPRTEEDRVHVIMPRLLGLEREYVWSVNRVKSHKSAMYIS